MKKSVSYLILFVLALMIWNGMVGHHGMSFNIDGEDFDGPLGGLAAALMAGGGILIGIVVAVIVAVIVALVCAGVGVVVVVALVLAAVLTLLAVSPLLLPLLIPVGIIWYVSSRNRQRGHDTKAHAA